MASGNFRGDIQGGHNMNVVAWLEGKITEGRKESASQSLVGQTID